MSYLDIATSLATNSLTLFVGTGLSKHLTDGKAPSWLELLIDCATRLEDQKVLKDLFYKDDDEMLSCKMELTVCAQILELEYTNQKKDIREEIKLILEEKINENTINQDKVSELRAFLVKHPSINIVTTNYDNLLSDYVLEENRRVVIDVATLAKINNGINIYHIHGAIMKPSSIILTMNDYFKFQHKESYLARKLYTLIQESTVVILGYSLGDFNLNNILNEVHSTKNLSYKISDTYYVSRDSIDKIFKRYYLHTFGIDVIEKCSVSKLLNSVSKEYPHAKRTIVDKAPTLHKIINGESDYSDVALKTKGFLHRLILRASVVGIEPEDSDFQTYLLKVLERKTEFCKELHAWDQYPHITEWLIYLGTVLDFNSFDTKRFKEVIRHCLINMGKDSLGYSWESYEIWMTKWNNLKQVNKEFILQVIADNSFTASSGVHDLKRKYDN
ncbi:SIR2 family protein [Saccharibacillus sacchari]|uniref:SIR2 family protein n=1 Tax=Saccharibacillus sacchari TaxID=456493 RepID=UPI0004BCEA10|nr:SIR2 family protein [Saccharibacillus sacchari]